MRSFFYLRIKYSNKRDHYSYICVASGLRAIYNNPHTKLDRPGEDMMVIAEQYDKGQRR